MEKCSCLIAIFSLQVLCCLFIYSRHLFFPVSSQTSSFLRKCCVKFPHCEAIPEEAGDGKESPGNVKESTPLLSPPPITLNVPPLPPPPQKRSHWVRMLNAIFFPFSFYFNVSIIKMKFGLTVFITKPDLAVYNNKV